EPRRTANSEFIRLNDCKGMVVRGRAVQLNTMEGASKAAMNVATCVRRCCKKIERAQASGFDSSTTTSPSEVRIVGIYGPLVFADNLPATPSIPSRIDSASRR